MTNALDLTTIANAKSWLGIKGNENDDDLQRLVTSASAFAQSWLNRIIGQTAYTDYRDGHGGSVMITAEQPIITVTSIVIDGITQPAASYTTNQNGIYLTNGIFTRAKNNVQLNYTAGYSSVPFDIEQAIIETIALRWKERDRIGMSSKAIAGETTSFIIKDFPASALTALKQYKKVISL